VGGLVACESLHGDPTSQFPNGFHLLGQTERVEPRQRRVLMLARPLSGISFVTPWQAIGGAIRSEDDLTASSGRPRASWSGRQRTQRGVDGLAGCYRGALGLACARVVRIEDRVKRLAGVVVYDSVER